MKERAWWLSPPVLFALIFVSVFLLHVFLLQLPYFWDEAGYYIPAARDIFLTGSLIPKSTVSNAHPPLVMIWLALWWKVVGYAPTVTRSAMLVVAAFALLGVFRLAERVSDTKVAFAATLCSALYPVFFAQSSLAQVDLAAAGFTFWGLAAYVEGEALGTAFWFALAGLAKETAILAPLALIAWEIVRPMAGSGLGGKLWSQKWRQKSWKENDETDNTAADTSILAAKRRVAALAISVVPLAFWYGYHYSRTGYVFGNPEFFRYNISATLNPTRFFLALTQRVWQLCGYLHLWILMLAALLAMWMLPPEHDSGLERPRISFQRQMIFYVVIGTYVVAMSLIGGAVLGRYMLPAIPLVIILCVSTLWRRVRYWTVVTGFVALAFVAAWFWNPPYGFSPEDNLAYRDYAILHKDGEQFLEARYPMARVLTAWPASDEITRPWLGYITRPMQVERIDDFSLNQVLSAAELYPDYDIALIFSTKYEPGPLFWGRWKTFAQIRAKLKTRFFGYHRDLAPNVAARILGGRIVYSEQRHGQWIAIIERQGI
ncbi:MAG: glycosyltransferase family 39 protein [Candidatus Sulfotelmatobacter sp.]